MALITLSELKAVLGIGDIYANALVQECADSAENIILGMLTKQEWAIVSHQRVSSVATLTTDRPHDFYVGQSVTVANCGTNFNGSKTITKVTPYTISYASAYTDQPNHSIRPYGKVTGTQYIDYSTIPEVREAALAIASDIWITRTGTLGQQGVDFQSPAPYRLGRSLFTRVSGLLGKWIDTNAMVG